MACTRSGYGCTGGTGFVAIEICCNPAHVLKCQHAGFSRLCAQRLFLEVRPKHFGAVGGCQKGAGFIQGLIHLGRFAAGDTVEEIDEARGEILAVGFERGVGEQREEIGPDRSQRMSHVVLAREVGIVERRRRDREAG